jgi:RimJ/RimL family protein N-acetyltransferase/predicted SprT family Zn-dependent metalloprotease
LLVFLHKRKEVFGVLFCRDQTTCIVETEMTKVPDTETPNLQGKLVRLEPLNESFLSPYLEMLADPEGRKLTATSASFSEPQIREWLLSRESTSGRIDWAIIERDTNEFAGEVVLNEFDAKKNSMNLRIALRGPNWFGRGLGGEAVALVLEHVFNNTKLTKVTLEVLVENGRAIGAYEKSGFQPGRQFSEGKLRFLRMSCDRYDFIRALAERKMAEHLDLENWQFGFDSAKRRAGLCNYTNKTITISRYHVDIHTIDETMQVVLHEVAHAMCGKREGHNKKWLATAKSIGYRAERFTGTEIAQETASWIGTCKNGHKHYRYRQPSRPLACGLCGRGFTRANLIVWQHRDQIEDQ